MKIITEKKQWNESIKSFPFWDVSHLWGYHEAFRLRDPSFEARLFLFECEQGRLAYPFCLKKLSLHPEYSEKGENRFYLDTVYGHVGPLYEGDSVEKIWQACEKDFRQYCEDENIVLIQERFHPVYQNQIKLFPESQVYEKRKLVVCTTLDFENLYHTTHRKNRRYLRMAKENDLQFIQAGIEEIDDFLALYYDTMERNQAEEVFYFEKEFFVFLHEELQELFTLFFCYKDGKRINGTISLHSPTSGIGFVMGNDRNYRKYNLGFVSAANFLDYFNTIDMSKLIVGGGNTTALDDPMLRSKMKYTQEEPVSFYVGKTVLWPELEEGDFYGNSTLD